jgi:hypothetical protein
VVVDLILKLVEQPHLVKETPVVTDIPQTITTTQEVAVAAQVLLELQ